jgi:uncharacterized membrane-anchored protein
VKPEHMPSLGTRYWTALILASVFGANTGDFLSDVLGLGHVAGLPVLAVLLGFVFLAERFDRMKHHAYFWSAIIVIRSAATNLGDLGRDFHLPALGVAAILAVVLALTLVAWARIHPRGSSDSLSAVPVYWWTMLVAGALGTVVGDYCSYGLGLGNLGAALALGTVLAALFAAGRHGRLSRLVYYWATVVCIRSAGTAAGDFLAHKLLGLPLGTLASGIAFVVLLGLWRVPVEAGEDALEPA